MSFRHLPISCSCDSNQETFKSFYIQPQSIQHGRVLESITCSKYLGVDISPGILTLTGYLAVQTAHLTLCGATLKVRETTYNNHVRPQLDYSSAHLNEDYPKRTSPPESCSLSNFYLQASVTKIVQSLGWRSLEPRRTDAHVFCFIRFIHGLVSIPHPDYIQYNNRVSISTVIL